MDRRRFFREGLRELLRPVAKAVDPIHRVATELGNLDPVPAEPAAASPPPPMTQSRGSFYGSSSPVPESPAATDAMNWLRPPGALPEPQFLSTCSRCAKCADVCPVQCIKIDPDRTRADGAPYIEADANPCVLCTGLECMHHCPTGALVPTPLAEIDMGTAVWHEYQCVRSHGEECTMCVDHCPVGSAALELDGDRVVVHEDGCVGCGVCQNNCPTDPKSITVTPRRVRDGHAVA
jgi:MauM/NapG family ferredoxin protein